MNKNEHVYPNRKVANLANAAQRADDTLHSLHTDLVNRPFGKQRIKYNIGKKAKQLRVADDKAVSIARKYYSELQKAEKRKRSI